MGHHPILSSGADGRLIVYGAYTLIGRPSREGQKAAAVIAAGEKVASTKLSLTRLELLLLLRRENLRPSGGILGTR
jgi:hypothetical protein